MSVSNMIGYTENTMSSLSSISIFDPRKLFSTAQQLTAQDAASYAVSSTRHTYDNMSIFAYVIQHFAIEIKYSEWWCNINIWWTVSEAVCRLSTTQKEVTDIILNMVWLMQEHIHICICVCTYICVLAYICGFGVCIIPDSHHTITWNVYEIAYVNMDMWI